MKFDKNKEKRQKNTILEHRKIARKKICVCGAIMHMEGYKWICPNSKDGDSN